MGEADAEARGAVDYSVVIPAYNEEALLPRALTSVRAAMRRVPGLTGEIVVADNASTDRTAEVARAGGARVVHEPHRQIARARNAGVGAARGRWLAFLDADSLVPPALLRHSLGALASGRCCGGGSRIASDRRLHLGEYLFFHGILAVMKLTHTAGGAYTFCLREAFEAVGGFDERYYAGEEAHFSRALKGWGRRHGLDFVVLDDSAVSSARTLDRMGLGGLVKEFWRMSREPELFESREGCAMWYDRPARGPSDT